MYKKTKNSSPLTAGATDRSLTAERLNMRLRVSELTDAALSHVTGGGYTGTSCGRHWTI